MPAVRGKTRIPKREGSVPCRRRPLRWLAQRQAPAEASLIANARDCLKPSLECATSPIRRANLAAGCAQGLQALAADLELTIDQRELMESHLATVKEQLRGVQQGEWGLINGSEDSGAARQGRDR